MAISLKQIRDRPQRAVNLPAIGHLFKGAVPVRFTQGEVLNAALSIPKNLSETALATTFTTRAEFMAFVKNGWKSKGPYTFQAST